MRYRLGHLGLVHEIDEIHRIFGQTFIIGIAFIFEKFVGIFALSFGNVHDPDVQSCGRQCLSMGNDGFASRFVVVADDDDFRYGTLDHFDLSRR